MSSSTRLCPVSRLGVILWLMRKVAKPVLPISFCVLAEDLLHSPHHSFRLAVGGRVKWCRLHMMDQVSLQEDLELAGHKGTFVIHDDCVGQAVCCKDRAKCLDRYAG